MDGTDGSIRILVVEDEEDYAALLASYLEKHGYAVSVSLDGEDAWRRLTKDPPDLITLDYMMPRRTGLKFYRDLRRDEKLRKIPIVLVTGITAAGTKERNLFAASPRLGAPEGYLEKPVSEENLIGTIEDVLRQRRSPRPERDFSRSEAQ